MNCLHSPVLVAAVLVAIAATGTAKPLEPKSSSDVVEGESHDADDDIEELRKRIIGGKVATYGDHPYICALKYDGRRGWSHGCGAVIYNAKTLLTAAHCLFDKQGTPVPLHKLKAMCGEFRTNYVDDYEQSRDFSGKKVHPSYDASSKDIHNDIALLQLSSPLTFDRHVHPLPIDNGTTTVTGPCVLSGWGRTEPFGTKSSTILKDISISPLTNRDCAKLWKNEKIYDGNICFNDAFTVSGPCNGDSGGPAVCNDVIVGVTSWGLEFCNSTQLPSVYTRVSHFYDWIVANAC